MSGAREPSKKSGGDVRVTFEQVPEDAATLEQWADAPEIIRKLARQARAERKRKAASKHEIDGNENSKNAA